MGSISSVSQVEEKNPYYTKDELPTAMSKVACLTVTYKGLERPFIFGFYHNNVTFSKNIYLWAGKSGDFLLVDKYI